VGLFGTLTGAEQPARQVDPPAQEADPGLAEVVELPQRDAHQGKRRTH
jgi:hypothetical protein